MVSQRAPWSWELEPAWVLFADKSSFADLLTESESLGRFDKLCFCQWRPFQGSRTNLNKKAMLFNMAIRALEPRGSRAPGPALKQSQFGLVPQLESRKWLHRA